MTRLEMKNRNIILTEKEQKYQNHYQVKIINTNILQVNKYSMLINDK